jgi:hypothetical protein
MKIIRALSQLGLINVLKNQQNNIAKPTTRTPNSSNTKNSVNLKIEKKMKFSTPEISWHERDPIYTIAFHSLRDNVIATAGVTGVIRVKLVIC